MERQEYIRRLIAAFDAMDDRARHLQLGQFERAAADYPRAVPSTKPTEGRVVPFRRVANQ
jgi:hypothetical protein